MNAAARNRIRTQVRYFVAGLPTTISLEPNNRRTNRYDAILWALTETFCSSSKGSTLRIPCSHTRNGSQQDRDTIPNLNLPEDVRKSIENTRLQTKGVSFVVVDIVPRRGLHHSCVLVFDARTRMQHFFNPWGYHSHWLQDAIAHRAPFVPGFRVAPVARDSWPDGQRHNTLQDLFDNVGTGNSRERGNCGVYIVLVVVLCMRFGVGDPKMMAQLFIDVCRAQQPANAPAGSVVTRRLWTWISNTDPEVQTLTSGNFVYAYQRRAARISICNKLFHRSQPAVCGVYCPSSSRTCGRRPCPNDVMCWQHRFLFRNKDRVGGGRMRCNAPRAQCLNR